MQALAYTCVGKSLGEQVRREFVAVRGDGIEHDECWHPGGGEKLYRVGDRLQF